MKKLSLLTLCLLTILSIDLTAQTEIEKKVQKMLELTNSKQQFDLAIDQMIEIQQETYGELLSAEFFDRFREKIKNKGFNEISEMLTPIYLEHLTEKELDGIIQFYESEAGASFLQKMPFIMTESMQVGAEWGKKMGEEIAIELSAQSNEELKSKFNTKPKASCAEFKKGTFTETFPDGTTIEFKRKKNKQTEIWQDLTLEFDIKWLSDNQYQLEGPLNNIEDLPSEILMVNIYEVNENSYKYVVKSEEDVYVEGEVLKKE